MTPAALAGRIGALRPARGRRTLTAIVGPPASGKSTLAQAVVAALGPAGALVPMDGFHLDDRVLTARGLLPRKGSPETFDVGGLGRALAAAREADEVIVPLFDRAREIAIAGALVVPPEARHVVVEGNWLLLDAPGWRDLPDWDLSVRIEVGEPELRRRLGRRWAAMSPGARRAKIDENDIPNARRMARDSRPADVVLADDGETGGGPSGGR